MSSLVFYHTASGGKWKCSACLVQNNADQVACVACQTKNPLSGQTAAPATASNTASPTATPAAASGWGNLFRNNAGAYFYLIDFLLILSFLIIVYWLCLRFIIENG